MADIITPDATARNRNKLNCEPIQVAVDLLSVHHTDVSVNYFLHGGYARTNEGRVFVDLAVDAIFRSPRDARTGKKRGEKAEGSDEISTSRTTRVDRTANTDKCPVARSIDAGNACER